MRLQGQCHCGNIHYVLDWNPEPDLIPARACDCTFCQKHGARWTGTPDGTLALNVRDASQLSRYTFGTHTASFLICTRCGVAAAVLCEVEGTLHAVVNVQTLEGVDAARLHPVAASFGTEDAASRLQRRQRNWIGRVTYREGVTAPAA